MWQDPVISPPANQFRAPQSLEHGPVDRLRYRLGLLEFAKRQNPYDQVTHNTDCRGRSVEYRRFNFAVRDDTRYRVAFSIANIGTFGNLKKRERLF